jgi:hypothetical protein
MGANAQTTVPTFTAGQVLTADQMNQSARTGVPVFADATARNAGFNGTGEKILAEGQLAYLEDLNVVQYYDGAAWATVGPSTSGVVQVIQTTKLDTFSSSSTSFTDITGLSVSITPTNASNKVLFMVNIGTMGNSSSAVTLLQLLRTTTNILTPSGGTNPAAVQFYQIDANDSYPASMTVLDSPATTSATTYKIQGRCNSGTFFINRLPSDVNFTAVSTVTVMEVLP